MSNEREVIQLLKQKQDIQLLIKRGINKNLQNDDVDENVADQNTLSNRSSINDELIKHLYSINEEDQLKAIKKFRQILSSDSETSLVIDAIISAGVIPRFVEFLQSTNNSRLQFEAAWTLTNIVSGTPEQAKKVVEANAIPVFICLLKSSDEDVQEQAVWALGHITSYPQGCRDYNLNKEIMKPLLNLLNRFSDIRISTTQMSVWTLSNLFYETIARHDFVMLALALQVFAELLTHDDVDVLLITCTTISYLSEGINQNIQEIIFAGVCPNLVRLLLHTDNDVVNAALRAVGNLLAGDNIQTQLVLNCSVLPCLLSLLESPQRNVLKKTCWAISNIAAGNKYQIQAVLNKNIFPVLIHIMNTAEFEVKKEAAQAIQNATNNGTLKQIQYLVDHKCIPSLSDLLTERDVQIILVALNSLENILKSGEKLARQTGTVNQYAVLLDECYGRDKIDFLKFHNNIEVYQKSWKIIERYYDCDEDDSCMTPSVQEANQELE